MPFSEKTSLLLSCDVGGRFGVSGMLGINDFIARPAVGISLSSSDKRFAHNITIGYDFDKMITHVSGVKAYSNLSALSLHYGFQF